MSPQPKTQGERLVRMETLLLAIDERLQRIEKSQEKTDADVIADKAELEKLKNRGWGFAVALGLVSGAIGAKIETILGRLFS